jgi:hypothetical protein
MKDIALLVCNHKGWESLFEIDCKSKFKIAD